ncbi:PAS domain S-box protein, partial [candidate division KSB3 bacterium]|nr:PAS domain S-box protein [candidate division KSB3 bacterium]MBD3324551.1 PAS domain S-box protein [candidate division KSB3 bacterium]
TLWFSDHRFPIRDARGQIVAVGTIGRNITDLKRAEEAVRRSEATLKKAQEVGHLGHWERDLATNQIWWSEETFRIFGLSPKEFTPRYEEILTHLHPQDRHLLVTAIQEAIDTCQFYAVTYRVIRPDGEVRSVYSAGEAICDAAGTPVRMFGIVQDVTEQRQREEELKTKNSQLAALHEISQQITSTLNLHEVLDMIARQTAVLLQADTGVILLLDDARQTLRIHGAYGISEEAIRDTCDRIGESIAGRVVQSGKPLIVHDLPHNPLFENPAGIEEGLLACASVPLWAGGRIIGTLDIHSKADPAAFDEGHLHLLKLFASQAAIAIENARLYEALRESEEKFRQLTDNLDDVFWLRTDDEMLYISPSYEQVWGEPCERLHAQPNSFIERIHPEDKPRFLDAFRKDVLPPHLLEDEYRLVRPDGSVRWIHVKTFPVVNDAGEVYRSAGIARDITEQKQAEEALRLSEARLRQVIDLVPHPLFARDRQGRYVLANQALAALHDASPEDVLGKTHSELYKYPAEYQQYLADDRTVFETGKPMMIPEETYTPTHGPQRILQVTKIPYVISGTDEPAVLGIAIDITARKQAEEALRESEKKYRTLFEAAKDAILVADAETGMLLDANPMAEELLGREQAEIIGLHQTALHPSYQETHARESFREDGKRTAPHPLYREFEVMHKEGYPIPVEITPSKVEIAGKMCILGIFRDVRERKQREEELQEAKEKADAANRAKSEFIANMNHELRAPLTAIKGNAEILQHDSKLTETQRDWLRAIVQSANHLMTLIEDILDLARIEAGKIAIRLKPFDLQGLLGTLKDIHSFRAHQKGLPLIFDFAPDLPVSVCGDETRLRQILLNLVGNAVKFTDQGTVVLRVKVVERTTRASESGGDVPVVTLRFEVTDTGRGISADQLDTIFDPFFQGDASNEGTGLGLTIVQRLATAMGSAVRVESAEGEGSRFWFELTLEEIASPPTSYEADATSPLIPPPQAAFEELRRFVLAGNISEIRRWVTRHQDFEAQYLPFVNRIDRLARAFEINDIKRLLQECDDSSTSEE